MSDFNDIHVARGAEAVRDMIDAALPIANNPVPPEFADEALSSRLIDNYGGKLRYVAAWNKWLIYDGKIWSQDATWEIIFLARKICREASAECQERRRDAPRLQAERIASAQTVMAVEKLARADRRVAATTEQWDANLWLLNTPDGVTDLRTGKTRAHKPEDYMTKMAAVSPSGDCPLWRNFLNSITAGDIALQKFMQRMIGYALTGLTKEHALFFLYGTGGNGKGVFLNTLTAILRAYAATADMNTFTASSSERHTTDLAMLRGARVVTAQETEEGRRWAESRIKSLTGGDPITARFMRQDNFTFTPQFKLIIAGNHKPGLRAVDAAIRRRFHLIPFTVTIPPENMDKDLPEKLKTEWPGILRWMIEGCQAWQETGLAAPQVVTEATAEYLASEDALGAWLGERCELDGDGFEQINDLYQNFVGWGKDAGEHTGSKKAFSQKLDDRGFQRGHGRDKYGFLGIRLKRAHQPNFYGEA